MPDPEFSSLCSVAIRRRRRKVAASDSEGSPMPMRGVEGRGLNSAELSRSVGSGSHATHSSPQGRQAALASSTTTTSRKNLAERGVRQDASGVCLVPVCTTRVGVPHPVLRVPARKLACRRSREGGGGELRERHNGLCGVLRLSSLVV